MADNYLIDEFNNLTEKERKVLLKHIDDLARIMIDSYCHQLKFDCSKCEMKNLCHLQETIFFEILN